MQENKNHTSGLFKTLPNPENKSKQWFNHTETNPGIFKPEIVRPKISIVIPSFNQGAFIEDTIRSIILQNYPNLELIIIDGSSADNTIDIIRKYAPYIKYWVSEPDSGQSDAINKGIRKCTGSIFNWLNSDDFLEINALYHIAKAFIATSPRIVSGKTNIIKNGIIQSTIPFVKIYSNINSTIKECGFNQPGLFYDMNSLKQLNGVDPTFQYAMDLDLWNRFLFMFGQKDVITINTVIANFRVHEDSKTYIEGKNENSKFSIDINGMYYTYCKYINKEQIYLKSKKVDEKFLKNVPYSEIPKNKIKDFFNYYFYLIFKSHLYRWRLRKAVLMISGIDRKFLLSNLFRDFKIIKLLPKSLRTIK